MSAANPTMPGSPGTSSTSKPPGGFRKLDAETPIGIKLGVLLGLIGFAIGATWFASELKASHERRISLAEQAIQQTNQTVQEVKTEIREGIRRIEDKLDRKMGAP